jgi:hypothetical protein
MSIKNRIIPALTPGQNRETVLIDKDINPDLSEIKFYFIPLILKSAREPALKPIPT